MPYRRSDTEENVCYDIHLTTGRSKKVPCWTIQRNIDNFSPNIDTNSDAFALRNENIESYSTLQLIDDLKEHLRGEHPEILADLFPRRLERFGYNSLSLLWNKEQSYINGVIYKLTRDRLDFRFSDTNILNLQDILLDNFSRNKLNSTLSLISNYFQHKLNTLEFIERIRMEIARNSGIIGMTYRELSLILKGNEFYIKDLRRKINNPNRKGYNPDFKFSLERLDEFKESLRLIQINNCCAQFIEKYIKLNPDLPLYSHQQYTIKNPRYFQYIDIPEKAYWFGFLGVDASLPNRKHNSYLIRFELAKKDKERLEVFSRRIGLDINRVKERKRLIVFNNKDPFFFDVVYISFACKPMFNDLVRSGYLEMKDDERKVPHIIISLFKKAKIVAFNTNQSWYTTLEGRIALAWLLGFYDGDGNYQGGRSAIIYSASKSLLENIKSLYDIVNDVRIIKEYEVEDVDKTVEKKIYGLTLGPDLVEAIMLSYKNSMERKRLR